MNFDETNIFDLAKHLHERGARVDITSSSEGRMQLSAIYGGRTIFLKFVEADRFDYCFSPYRFSPSVVRFDSSDLEESVNHLNLPGRQ